MAVQVMEAIDFLRIRMQKLDEKKWGDRVEMEELEKEKAILERAYKALLKSPPPHLIAARRYMCRLCSTTVYIEDALCEDCNHKVTKEIEEVNRYIQENEEKQLTFESFLEYFLEKQLRDGILSEEEKEEVEREYCQFLVNVEERRTTKWHPVTLPRGTAIAVSKKLGFTFNPLQSTLVVFQDGVIVVRNADGNEYPIKPKAELAQICANLHRGCENWTYRQDMPYCAFCVCFCGENPANYALKYVEPTTQRFTHKRMCIRCVDAGRNTHDEEDNTCAKEDNLDVKEDNLDDEDENLDVKEDTIDDEEENLDDNGLFWCPSGLECTLPTCKGAHLEPKQCGIYRDGRECIKEDCPFSHDDKPFWCEKGDCYCTGSHKIPIKCKWKRCDNENCSFAHP